MMTSRGCPYPCTFCSVAPVWNLESHSRSPRTSSTRCSFCNREAGVDLFLFQDEFFVSGKTQVMEFCSELASPRPGSRMEGVRAGESGGRGDDAGDGRRRLRRAAIRDRVGLRPRAATRSRRASPPPKRLTWCPRPCEFSRASMRSSSGDSRSRRWRIFTNRCSRWFRSACWARGFCPACCRCCRRRKSIGSGASRAELEFCPYLFPEFVFTGHEVCRGGQVELPERHAEYFRPDHRPTPTSFPGFFHIDLAGNVLPKLALLRQFGFYPEPEPSAATAESCGAHSPRVAPQELATRTGRS